MKTSIEMLIDNIDMSAVDSDAVRNIVGKDVLDEELWVVAVLMTFYAHFSSMVDLDIHEHDALSEVYATAARIVKAIREEKV